MPSALQGLLPSRRRPPESPANTWHHPPKRFVSDSQGVMIKEMYSTGISERGVAPWASVHWLPIGACQCWRTQKPVQESMTHA